jgi:hypothetical protein
MQDDRDQIARYRQAALAAREKTRAAIEPTQWHQIADAWDQLAVHAKMLELSGADSVADGLQVEGPTKKGQRELRP